MDAQESKLRQQLQGTGVSVVRHGDDIVLNMPGNVTFPVNQADVRAEFFSVLDSVGLVVGEYDKTLIDITGHTDSTGDGSYNLSLSQRRANSVGAYLQSRGITSQRILTQGFGENNPVADNSTPQGRRENRRVELVLKPIVQG